MDRKDYTVTALAGPKVAGRPVEKGQVLQLTEREAEAELLAGALTKGNVEGDKLAKAGTHGEDTPRLNKLRDRAKGLDAIEPDGEPAEPAPAPAPAPAETKPAASGRKASAQA